MSSTCTVTWHDAIKASNEYIELLTTKMHNMYSVDCKFKEMWHQKLVVALCRHQEIAVLHSQENIK